MLSRRQIFCLPLIPLRKLPNDRELLTAHLSPQLRHLYWNIWCAREMAVWYVKNQLGKQPRSELSKNLAFIKRQSERLADLERLWAAPST
jgi:hypothetical protein